MSGQRAVCLEQLRDRAGCEVVLVTPRELGRYVPAEALHPAYPHLSLVHRSDYLRCWFMHHLGGGYSDIKRCDASWQPAFDGMDADAQAWINGYPETSPRSVANLYQISRQLGESPQRRAAAYLHRKWLQLHWWKLIGCGAFICRPGTPLTAAWWRELNRRLDRLLPQLRRSPARHPRDNAENGAGYPVPWTYLHGAILQPLCLRQGRHVLNTLPKPDFRAYL